MNDIQIRRLETDKEQFQNYVNELRGVGGSAVQSGLKERSHPTSWINSPSAKQSKGISRCSSSQKASDKRKVGLLVKKGIAYKNPHEKLRCTKAVTLNDYEPPWKRRPSSVSFETIAKECKMKKALKEKDKTEQKYLKPGKFVKKVILTKKIRPTPPAEENGNDIIAENNSFRNTTKSNDINFRNYSKPWLKDDPKQNSCELPVSSTRMRLQSQIESSKKNLYKSLWPFKEDKKFRARKVTAEGYTYAEAIGVIKTDEDWKIENLKGGKTMKPLKPMLHEQFKYSGKTSKIKITSRNAVKSNLIGKSRNLSFVARDVKVIPSNKMVESKKDESISRRSLQFSNKKSVSTGKDFIKITVQTSTDKFFGNGLGRFKPAKVLTPISEASEEDMQWNKSKMVLEKSQLDTQLWVTKMKKLMHEKKSSMKTSTVSTATIPNVLRQNTSDSRKSKKVGKAGIDKTPTRKRNKDSVPQESKSVLKKLGTESKPSRIAADFEGVNLRCFNVLTSQINNGDFNNLGQCNPSLTLSTNRDRNDESFRKELQLKIANIEKNAKYRDHRKHEQKPANHDSSNQCNIPQFPLLAVKDISPGAKVCIDDRKSKSHKKLKSNIMKGHQESTNINDVNSTLIPGKEMFISTTSTALDKNKKDKFVKVRKSNSGKSKKKFKRGRYAKVDRINDEMEEKTSNAANKKVQMEKISGNREAVKVNDTLKTKNELENYEVSATTFMNRLEAMRKGPLRPGTPNVPGVSSAATSLVRKDSATKNKVSGSSDLDNDGTMHLKSTFSDSDACKLSYDNFKRERVTNSELTFTTSADETDYRLEEGINFSSNSKQCMVDNTIWNGSLVSLHKSKGKDRRSHEEDTCFESDTTRYTFRSSCYKGSSDEDESQIEMPPKNVPTRKKKLTKRGKSHKDKLKWLYTDENMNLSTMTNPRSRNIQQPQYSSHKRTIEIPQGRTCVQNAINERNCKLQLNLCEKNRLVRPSPNLNSVHNVPAQSGNIQESQNQNYSEKRNFPKPPTTTNAQTLYTVKDFHNDDSKMKAPKKQKQENFHSVQYSVKIQNPQYIDKNHTEEDTTSEALNGNDSGNSKYLGPLSELNVINLNSLNNTSPYEAPLTTSSPSPQVKNYKQKSQIHEYNTNNINIMKYLTMSSKFCSDEFDFNVSPPNINNNLVRTSSSYEPYSPTLSPFPSQTSHNSEQPGLIHRNHENFEDSVSNSYFSSPRVQDTSIFQQHNQPQSPFPQQHKQDLQHQYHVSDSSQFTSGSHLPLIGQRVPPPPNYNHQQSINQFIQPDGSYLNPGVFHSPQFKPSETRMLNTPVFPQIDNISRNVIVGWCKRSSQMRDSATLPIAISSSESESSIKEFLDERRKKRQSENTKRPATLELRVEDLTPNRNVSYAYFSLNERNNNSNPYFSEAQTEESKETIEDQPKLNTLVSISLSTENFISKVVGSSVKTKVEQHVVEIFGPVKHEDSLDHQYGNSIVMDNDTTSQEHTDNHLHVPIARLPPSLSSPDSSSASLIVQPSCNVSHLVYENCKCKNYLNRRSLFICQSKIINYQNANGSQKFIRQNMPATRLKSKIVPPTNSQRGMIVDHSKGNRVARMLSYLKKTTYGKVPPYIERIKKELSIQQQKEQTKKNEQKPRKDSVAARSSRNIKKVTNVSVSISAKVSDARLIVGNKEKTKRRPNLNVKRKFPEIHPSPTLVALRAKKRNSVFIGSYHSSAATIAETERGSLIMSWMQNSSKHVDNLEEALEETVRGVEENYYRLQSSSSAKANNAVDNLREESFINQPEHNGMLLPILPVTIIKASRELDSDSISPSSSPSEMNSEMEDVEFPLTSSFINNASQSDIEITKKTCDRSQSQTQTEIETTKKNVASTHCVGIPSAPTNILLQLSNSFQTDDLIVPFTPLSI